MAKKKENVTTPWVNLKNDVMFGLIMDDPIICKTVIELLLGIRLKSVSVQSQDWIKDGFNEKGSRLDILATDVNGDLYDIEIQNWEDEDIGYRMRYYQSQMDHSALATGQPYKNIKKSFIIFICTYDPFEKGYWKYTFRPKCEEADVILETGQTWIVFNTKGCSGDLSEETQDFLRFVDDSTEENAKNDFLGDVLNKMGVIMQDPKRRIAIMTLEEKLSLMKDSYNRKLKREIREEVQKVREETKNEARKKTIELILNMHHCGIDTGSLPKLLMVDEELVNTVLHLSGSGKTVEEISAVLNG